ncbi:MAG: ABC transporter permease subunit [Deltaproteobacteria bacterium]|nr:ABC transporter permease subunit [Deltaproteobacteria bacterium]
MNKFWAVFKRELKVYFMSPIAYAVMVIFLVTAGYFFYTGMSYYSMLSFQAAQNPQLYRVNLSEIVMNPLFGNISVVMLLMIPALTMRLFAEEKKTGTYELLFTYPLRDVEVLLGKYFAAMGVFTVMVGLTGVYLILLLFLGKSVPDVVPAGYLGLFLMGAAFMSLGILVSAMTENQIVASVVSFGLLLILWLLSWTSSMVGPDLGKIFEYLSLIKHFQNFSRGLLDTADLAYYVCFIFFFLFLTLRILESKRWRG